MINRTFTTATAERQRSMRRLRRRSGSVQRPYCRTNGCASFLEVDPTSARATCAICGYSRRLD